MKHSPGRYTTTPKRDKIPQKNRSLLVHSVRVVYTAVVKVDVKVINMPPLTHVEIYRDRATPLN